MLKALTSSQKKIYDFYVNYIKKYKESPTYSVAAEYLHISEPAIFKHIKNLEGLGYLTKDSGGNIVIDNNQVRILGYISCGYGIELIENDIELIDIPRRMMKPGYNYYALIAKGSSMINANVSDGDILIIRHQSNIESGDIGVVVKDDGDVTLKRVYKRANDILLKPENDDFQSILLQNCEVRGKLVGVIRNF